MLLDADAESHRRRVPNAQRKTLENAYEAGLKMLRSERNSVMAKGLLVPCSILFHHVHLSSHRRALVLFLQEFDRFSNEFTSGGRTSSVDHGRRSWIDWPLKLQC